MTAPPRQDTPPATTDDLLRAIRVLTEQVMALNETTKAVNGNTKKTRRHPR